jgi:beta-lactamase class D
MPTRARASGAAMLRLAPRCPSKAAHGRIPRSRRWIALLGLHGLVGLAACARPPGAGSAAQVPVPVAAADLRKSAEAEAAVPLEGVEHPGCFMLLDLGGGPARWAGEQPCDERTTPASTFKVPHALIALDTGVVTDADAKAKWDGTPRWMDVWNQDHSLRTAIEESVLWFFQGTARAIGRERMREYLQAFEYGDAEVEGPIDVFWLDGGSLQVSPEEQLRFVARLYRDELPRGREHLPLLRELLVRPDLYTGRMPEGTPRPRVHPEVVFSGKTGTDAHAKGNVTWLVGHVACPGREHVFVSRVIASGEPDVISPAVTHGMAALDRTGVLRCETDHAVAVQGLTG